MPNESNLKPQAHKLTVEEQSKGGKKSAKSRRNKKLMKEQMQHLLSLPVTNEKHLKLLLKMGVEETDNKMLVCVALFKRALSGDVSAYKEIRSVIGEDKENNNEQIQKLDEVLDKIGGNI